MKKENLIRAFLWTGFLSFMLFMLISCEKASPKKEIGLQLYSLRDSIFQNVAGTLDKVGKMGYTFVETAGYRDGKIYGMDPVEFRNLCEKYGLKFLGAHTGRDLPDSAN